MLKKLCCIVLCIALSAQAADLAPQPQHQRAIRVSTALLGHYHYKPTPVDDQLSAAIFERYLKSLDGDKYYFVQADIDQLNGYRTRLDDAINDEDLQPAFAIFNLYTRRVEERFVYARELLKTGGFRFDQNERFAFDRDKASWAPSEDALRQVWQLRVKNDWLRLKLAGKADSEIATMLDKRYEQSIRRVKRLKSDDAFQAFMNAYTMAIEPHTSYLGPRASADFDISMRLSLFGIGAVLQERDDYTVIREVTPGGPAALSGQLKAGDRIVAVAQGEGPFVDVVGSRLDETVALIRGPADSVVRLDILPGDAGPDARHRQISLVRKKVDLAQQAAKKSILDVSDGNDLRRIGVITLPTFYSDFEGERQGDRNARSATRDVERLLGELGKEKVDGVVLDLRHNGGGSLKEAIALTGLFIDTGPVVMERNAQGRVFVDGDSNPGTAWDGPLGVLIDGESASASEIFAAAIQDYGRGIVIGEQSYGKGTVQTVLNLDQAVGDDKANLGELRLTIAQFFRVNGGTTQLRGVQPDIAFPATSDPTLTGEASNDNALPWTRIRAAAYDRVADLGDIIPQLQARHAAWAANDPDFKKLAEVATELQRLRQLKSLSLNETERRRETEAQEKRFAGIARVDDGLLDSERDPEREKADEKAADKVKDIRLRGAAHIVADEVNLLRENARPAVQQRASQAALSH
ncbi:carboxy terminal-processing peptidase [Dechloromonas sp. XY25]|uniref:Carboxy terminal-processing peptidase n=1 Tax=Dechloromonas hankyongensis TaxID=2908002 RepID=A0ABS9K425_9RHOO|nr:carboxy terminal-processing peptidase [Dechloromonas hankyongensis]MCG2577919.1 carboxy terminal-processing peptidase [Dechloromonas hankyongensis]